MDQRVENNYRFSPGSRGGGRERSAADDWTGNALADLMIVLSALVLVVPCRGLASNRQKKRGRSSVIFFDDKQELRRNV